MDAKNRFPRGVKCTHLAGLAVSAARAAMGVAMADMCVAIETVDGCLSTTDSAAGDGSKTRDESTQQLALPTGLDTILAAIDFYAAARNPRVGSFFRMRGSIVRRSRTRFSLAISINHRVSNHGRCAAGFPKERNPTRVSTTTGHPGVNHGSVRDFQITNGASWSEPRMETEASGISIQGVQITIWVPSGNFTEATEAQTETADPYGTPRSAPWN